MPEAGVSTVIAFSLIRLIDMSATLIQGSRWAGSEHEARRSVKRWFTGEILTGVPSSAAHRYERPVESCWLGRPQIFLFDLGYRAVTNRTRLLRRVLRVARQTKYDFHDNTAPTDAGRHRPTGSLDHETKITYDTYGVLRNGVTDPINLQTKAAITTARHAANR